MTTTIAISSQKGGVAKTTTCLSLGACLAEMGKTVLLIDLDPQASLTLSLGLKPEHLRRSVEDALLGSASLTSVSRETAVFGLDVTPAGGGLVVLDKILYGRTGYEFYLRNALSAMDSLAYDYVLIDCPPFFSTFTLNALTAAGLLIIPTQCEFYASHSLRRVIELLKLVREKTNPQLTYRILVTMYDRRNKIGKIILEQLQQGLKGALFNTLIEIDTRLRESPVFSKPVTMYAPKTRGAEQYRALARELLNHEGSERV